MDILAAVDLFTGKVVRLTRGQIATAKVYGTDPMAVARAFLALLKEHLHPQTDAENRRPPFDHPLHALSKSSEPLGHRREVPHSREDEGRDVLGRRQGGRYDRVHPPRAPKPPAG